MKLFTEVNEALDESRKKNQKVPMSLAAGMIDDLKFIKKNYKY